MTRIQRNRVALLGGLAVLICAGLTAAGVLGLVSVAVALIATAGLVGATHARYQRALQDRQQLFDLVNLRPRGLVALID